MKRLTWKRNGTGYKSQCGAYEIKHTGTAGKSTRVFTAYRVALTALPMQVGNSGGLMACKGSCERDAETILTSLNLIN